MREISVTTKTLKRATGGLLILAMAMVVMLFGRPLFSWALSRFQPPATPTPDPAALVAIQGTEAFYTINASEGAEGWAERVCRLVEDEDVCQVYRQVFVPLLIRPLLDEHPDLDVRARVGEAVLVAEENGGRDRIYRLQAAVQGLPQNGDAPLLVQVHLDDGVWRFVRPLFEEEAASYLDLEKTPEP